MKVVTLITARGGSKEIPNKNIKELKGHPLIAYAITSSLNSNSNETWVSTDSDEIEKISKSYLSNVIKRPIELSQDNSKSEDALLHFANNVDFDILVFLQPTSPLLSTEYINKGIEMVVSGQKDSVFSAYKEHWFPRWTKDCKPLNWDINNRPMRQDVDYVFVENGAFYITTKDALLKSRLRYSGSIGIVEMPFSKSFQIDTLDDFELIKRIC